jgi:uncharacterized membrane protein YkoI
MNIRLLLTTVLLAAGGPQATASLDTGHLPDPVKKALDAEGAKESVREVKIHNADGQTVYDVELELKNAPNARLRISAEGKVLHDSRRAGYGQPVPAGPTYIYPAYTAPAPVPQLRMNELPAAVQETIKKEEAATGRKIDSIIADKVDGRLVYRVDLHEKGRNPRFYVAEDGTLLRPLEKPPVLGIGMTFSEAPKAVQEIIRRELDGGEIVKIQKHGRREEPARYEVEIRTQRGAFQLEISEEGFITRDSRKSP